MLKVGINGFGRIGRLALRVILQKHRQELLPVLINTSGKIDIKGWAHLFKWDSLYGVYQGEIKVENENLIIDGLKIAVTGQKEPKLIPWEAYGTEVVIEATGVFLKTEEVQAHLRGSVQKLILAAPPKDEIIPMFVIGVNEDKIAEEKIISCASCTTNCLAPLIKVMEKNFGIKKALMSTIHAYTSDQELLDGSHRDLRRARAAALNIVPTTTGAARSVAKIIGELASKFDGLAFRVPVAVGSLCDLVFLAGRPVSREEVNRALKTAAETDLKNILGVTEEPLVSRDIVGTTFSALVDLSLTQVVDADLVKLVAWYDNEWAYASRLVEEVILIGAKLG